MTTFREIVELLRYDPESGLLYWRGGPRRPPDGTVAGALSAQGYVRVTFKKRRYPAHRIAWLLTYGAWPEHFLDHVNGNRADNRIANLRLCTAQENQRNRQPAKRTRSGGLKGAVWEERTGRWLARIQVGRRRCLQLGTYDTPEEAHASYAKAAHKYFGEFARVA